MIFMSPQMFLFFVFYLFFIIMMSFVDSYIMFWSIMEFSTLIFMGLSYSAFKNSFSSLLLFFIIQSYSAFMLLFFFMLNMPIGFTFSILLKLSMFPFYFWYLSIIPFFSNFMFMFSSTFFKIPSIVMLYNFFYMVDYSLLMISVVLTIFVGSISMLSSSDMRFVLISSSVANNSWFVMSQLVSLFTFFVYFMVYFVVLAFIVYLMRNNATSMILNYLLLSDKKVLFLSVVTIAGLPPFPLFYVKVYVIYSVLVNTQSMFTVLALVLVAVLMLVGYLKCIFNVLMFNYSNMSYTFL